MLNIILIILLVIVVATRANKFLSRDIAGLYYRNDLLADKVANALVNDIVVRTFEARPLDNEDLDNSTIAKTGHHTYALPHRLNLPQNYQHLSSTFRTLPQRHGLSPSLPNTNVGYEAPSRSRSMLRATATLAAQARSRARATIPGAAGSGKWTSRLKRLLAQQVQLTRELAAQVQADPKKVAAAWTAATIAFTAGSEVVEAASAASAGRWTEVAIRAISTATQLTANQVDLAAAGSSTAGAADGAAAWQVVADSWQVVENIMEAGMKAWQAVELDHGHQLSTQ